MEELKKEQELIEKRIKEYENTRINQLINERDKLLKKFNKETIKYNNTRRYLIDLCRQIDGKNFPSSIDIEDKKYENLFLSKIFMKYINEDYEDHKKSCSKFGCSICHKYIDILYNPTLYKNFVL